MSGPTDGSIPSDGSVPSEEDSKSMTSDEEAQNAARTSQAAAAATEFTTADIHAGMSIQLSELSVRCWLRGIHESYGEHAADVMSLFAYCTHMNWLRPPSQISSK